MRWVAINNAIQLIPWADVLYACDFDWWKSKNGVPDFAGLKLSVDKQAAASSWDVQKLGVNKNDDRLELVKFGTVGWGGNGGFHALNLCLQFGASRILLVGYDMTVKHGVHWHGMHTGGLHNPKEFNTMRWRKCLDAASQIIRNLGVEVINTSPISALRNYPKQPLMEALEWPASST